MSLVARNFRAVRGLIPRASSRHMTTEDGSKSQDTESKAPPPPAASKPATSTTADADCTTYKCNEYYSYNELSFYDIENAMESKRVGQPSSSKSTK